MQLLEWQPTNGIQKRVWCNMLLGVVCQIWQTRSQTSTWSAVLCRTKASRWMPFLVWCWQRCVVWSQRQICFWCYKKKKTTCSRLYVNVINSCSADQLFLNPVAFVILTYIQPFAFTYVVWYGGLLKLFLTLFAPQKYTAIQAMMCE